MTLSVRNRKNSPIEKSLHNHIVESKNSHYKSFKNEKEEDGTE